MNNNQKRIKKLTKGKTMPRKSTQAKVAFSAKQITERAGR